MHDKLAAVSCCFQSRIIMVGSLANKVDDAIDELSILGDKAGALERKFNAYLEGAGGLWKADVLQIKGADDDSDVPAHLSDRKAICKALAGSFRVRYTSALSDPRVIAMKVFEHRLWPSAETNDGDDLQRFGIDQISRLLDNYSTFFDGVDNQQCMLQWNRLKHIIMKDLVLRSLPFEELWPRILNGFPELNVIARLIAITVILPVDTSSNERYFRLMNQFMGKQQTSMKHELLRNLMTWHDANRMLSPEQWQLALTHVVAAWLKADKTKTGQGVFRKDKLKKAGWVVRCGGGDMNQESSLEESYAGLVVARALE
jgi:hypothetical protein